MAGPMSLAESKMAKTKTVNFNYLASRLREGEKGVWGGGGRTKCQSSEPLTFKVE